MLPGRSNKQICNKLKIEDNSFSLIIICLLYVNTIVYVNYMSIQNWASLVAQDGKASACNAGRHGFNAWVRKIPWRRKWQSTPVFWPGKFHGMRSLVGHSPQSRKESDTTE